MLKGIKIKGVMDTPEEGHAFLVGLFEVLCPWRAGYQDRAHPPKYIKGEEHYYTAGRAAGAIALAWILIGLAKFILEVLL